MVPSPPEPADPTESRWRQIVDSAIDYAIVSSDLRGQVTGWNEGARQVLGWTAPEMMGQTLERFFTPEDVAAGQLQREMATALRDGRSMDERWHLRKGGERFWASGELMPLRDAAGAPEGFVKIVRDRTAQRQAETQRQRLVETLRASEERFQLALDVGGMGAWQGDLLARAAVWWPGMDLIHGLPAGSPALSGEAYFRLIHPEDRERVVDALKDAVLRRTGHRVEYRVVWPDGSIHWIEGRGKVALDADGEPTMVAGVCMDITRRKAVESDLRFLAGASAELARLTDYQSTLDKVARLAVPGFADWCAVDLVEGDAFLRVAVAHVDPAKVQLAHELHRRFPPDPAAPGGPWTVVRTARGELVPEITPAMLDASITDPLYLQTIRALGLYSYIGAPLVVRGNVLGLMIFITAESRRRYGPQDLALAEDLARRAAVAIENAKLLQALRDSDRAKDVFLATLAHELRNPLAPIWNGLTLLQKAPDDRQRRDQVAAILERQVAQLMRLVDDLLDVSRITTGKIELKKQPTNLVSILGNAVETSRPLIEAARHQLSLTFPTESTELEADPARLSQVFSNLLNNAAKYTPPGGQIDVAVEAREAQLVVRVRDNGTGIASDMLSGVFGLFTQVTHPSERRQGGLGIGLSLVEGLVRLHGGTVEARSAGLGQGCEFIVTLERQGPPPPPPGPALPDAAHGTAVPPAPSAPARRVLVVDDNVDAASVIAELLRMAGNEVGVAHDGASAVAATADFRPDVVLLDIGLPDINGYEVARQIRKLEGVRQPVLIALTGWGQKQDREMAVQAGFDQHWTKPVDPVRLQELASR